MTIQRIRRAVLLGLFLLIALPARAGAESPPPKMEAAPAWDGYLLGTWVEAQVTLTNEGADWDGILEITDDTGAARRYRQPVHLPAHSRKLIRLPYDAADFTLHVELQRRDGTVLQTIKLKLIQAQTTDGLVCAALGPPGTVSLLPGPCSRQISLQALEKLPETAPTWDTVDLLLLNGIDLTGLTAAQHDALLSWAAQGGYLIVNGGGTLPQTLAHLPAALQIARIEQPFNLPAAPFDPQHPLTGFTLRPAPEARALLLEGRRPLAVDRPFGQGRVLLVGWDLAQADWRWLDEQITDTDHPLTAIRHQIGGVIELGKQPLVPIYELFEIPDRLLPSRTAIYGLLIVYVLLMGPGSWFITRRLKKSVRAWWSFPLWITAALGLGAGLIAQTVLPCFPIRHEIALINIPAPAVPARVIQATALYQSPVGPLAWESAALTSTRMEGYEIRIVPFRASEEKIYPLPVTQIGNGATTRIEVPAAPLFSWQTEGLWNPPPLAITWTLTQTGEDFSIQGVFTAGIPFKKAALYTALPGKTSETYPLQVDPAAANPAVSFSRSITYGLTVYEEAHGQDNACVTIIDKNQWFAPSADIVPLGHPRLDCYLGLAVDTVPFPARLPGNAIQESCLLYRVPCPRLPDTRLEIPTGQIRACGIDLELFRCSYAPLLSEFTLHVNPGGGVELSWPDPLRLNRIEQIVIEFRECTVDSEAMPSPGPFTGTAKLWDFNRWEWVDWPHDGFRLILNGEESAPFLAPLQNLKLYLENPDSAPDVDCTLDIKITGTQ